MRERNSRPPGDPRKSPKGKTRQNRPANLGYLESPTLANYQAACLHALSHGDIHGAIPLAGAAVVIAPNDSETLRIADLLLGRLKMPLRQLHVEDGTFSGVSLLRARCLYRLGRVNEALSYLVQAAKVHPEKPFMVWALEWTSRNRDLRGIQASQLYSLCLALVEATLDTPISIETGAAAHLAQFVIRLSDGQPTDVTLRVLSAKALRAAGLITDAESRLIGAIHGVSCVISPDLETTSFDIEGRWAVWTELAAIAQTQGRERDRTELLLRATEIRPTEPSTWLDLAESALTQERFSLAHAHYTQAYTITQLAPGVHAHSMDLGAKLQFLRQLKARSDIPAADDPPEVSGVSYAKDLAAYTERLPDPRDSFIKIIRTSELGPIVKVRLDENSSISPTAAIAFFASHQASRLIVNDREVYPTAAWQPNFQLHSSGPPFGKTIVANIVDPLALKQVVLTPPTPPARGDAVQWLHAVQCVACRALGAHSAGRNILEGLLTNTDGWVTTAAIIGLRAVAHAISGERDSVSALFERLLTDDVHHKVYANALAVAGAELTTGDTRERFLALRARLAFAL